MSNIDLYRHFPRIRHRSNAAQVPVDKGRSTVLDRVPGTKYVRRGDVGPDNPSRFLQILVESISGKPLSSFFPVAEGIPKIIGVDGLANPAGFQSFLEGFHAAMQIFTLPNQPTVRQDDDTRRFLTAKSLGVRDAGNVRKATPRPVLKFDEFMAQMPPNPTTLQAALDAGADGIPIGFAESLSAFIGAMRSSVLANDAGALRNLGEDFGALLAALHEVVNGDEGAERSTRGVRFVRDHTTGSVSGPVMVRKSPASDTSRARVTAVEMDGEEFIIDPRTGKAVLKRKRRG